MSLKNESIKGILLEVETFLQALASQNLSKACKEDRQSLLDKINKLWEEFPALASPEKLKLLNSLDKNIDKNDESSRTGGSSNTDEGSEDPYGESGIPDIPASDLTDPDLSGMLEKRQRKGTFLTGPKLQKRWCLIRNGIFYYYESKKDKKQKGAFRLDGYVWRCLPDLVKDATKKELCFEVVCEPKRPYQFMAPSTEDLNKWREAIGTDKTQEPPDDDGELYEPIGLDNPTEPEEEPPLIEDDIYEEDFNFGADEPVEPTKSENPADDNDDEELYEDTAVETLSPPPPPPPKGRSLPELPPELPPARGQGQPPRTPLPPTPTETKKEQKITIVKPEEDFENMFYCKWEFTGRTSDELTIKKGDIVHVISKAFDAKSWWVGKINNNYGLVPKLNLAPAFQLATSQTTTVF